jgi:hypothetical protein
MKKKEKEEQPEIDILELVSVKKTSFAKISFGTGKGPYVVAFQDEATAAYCEMNSLDFKNVSINDLKGHKEIPIWEAGAKLPEHISKLPKLNLEKEKVKIQEAKEARKKAKVNMTK